MTIGAAEVRMSGIDSPELGQDCERAGGSSWNSGDAAAALLQELIANQPVVCEIESVDHYSRLISSCVVDGVNLSERMVTNGLAWAFVEFSDRYVAEDAAAKAAGVGIWREGSDPTPPWDYRSSR